MTKEEQALYLLQDPKLSPLFSQDNLTDNFILDKITKYLLGTTKKYELDEIGQYENGNVLVFTMLFLVRSNNKQTSTILKNNSEVRFITLTSFSHYDLKKFIERFERRHGSK